MSNSFCDASQQTTYFIMKCADLDSFHQCIKSNEWAWRRRNKQADPHDLLVSAHGRGAVILIFSVNGQHGWHGFCQSCFGVESTRGSSVELKVSEGENSVWHRFPVQWIVHYQQFNKYYCLDFKYTEHLLLPDGLPINKARNWQELTNDVGKELCILLKDHHTYLIEKEQEDQAMKKPESFFKSDGALCVFKEKEAWQTVIAKITKDLGKVFLACPFGSQRYNCNVPESDLDIFIVYQAKTTDMLGLDPPQQTIKNSHHEDVDYSVLELQRYCELLIKGDAKCVETLFLLETPVIVTSLPQWQKLCAVRNLLLNRQCLDKYMKEINGTTGLKQFQRWKEANPNADEITPKLAKLGYIILRLLQNAREMAKSNQMVIFRNGFSSEREELMTMRHGRFTYSQFIEIVNRYLKEIEENKGLLKADMDEAKLQIQDWLIDCRIQDLKQDPRANIS